MTRTMIVVAKGLWQVRVGRITETRMSMLAALLAAKALDRMRDRDGVDRAIEFDGMIREARRV